MSDPGMQDPRQRWQRPAMQQRLARRRASERRFARLGLAALTLALALLVALLTNILAHGLGAFRETTLRIEIDFDPQALGIAPDAPDSDAQLARADFAALIRAALQRVFPEATARSDLRELQALVSSGAPALLRERLRSDPSLLGRRLEIEVPVDDEVALRIAEAGDAPASGRLSERQLDWIRKLQRQGRIDTGFGTDFLRRGDSREPELAGVLGAVVGSFLTLIVTLSVAFPLGVAAAVYLEEFAHTGRWTRWIEVNINNLAAVPSIVFGLLGLAVFLNWMGLPRSAPLVGGLTLALMTLPTIVIAGRAALRAVPPSIREAARGIGASPAQVVAHHVLPLAMPGILTGTIIGLARALGETAPLLMVGMVAFVVDVPTSIRDASTVLPVQVYLWADSPERAFVDKVSGAILVLLGFLVLMNGAAIGLRQRFEKRW